MELSQPVMNTEVWRATSGMPFTWIFEPCNMKWKWNYTKVYINLPADHTMHFSKNDLNI